jgi:pimeloyl-ACP methyl ester carboxylesterase
MQPGDLAIHIGHSTGGGEVVPYLARHGESRAAKAVLISAVPPFMVKTNSNPGGLAKEVFDDLQAQLAAQSIGVLPGVAVRTVLRVQSAWRRAV